MKPITNAKYFLLHRLNKPKLPAKASS